jgi:hypothetical protein
MNLLKQAGQALATIAPTLATSLGGPLAGMAVTAIEGALGVDPKATPQAQEKAVNEALGSMTPEQIVALKAAENAHIEKMKELGVSEEQLVYQDVQNARAREIAVRDWVPASLAVLVTVGFFGVLAYMLIEGMPKQGGDALLVMLGSLGTAWATIIAYYFGSSLGSIKKDATIADIAKQS